MRRWISATFDHIPPQRLSNMEAMRVTFANAKAAQQAGIWQNLRLDVDDYWVAEDGYTGHALTLRGERQETTDEYEARLRREAEDGDG